MFTPQRRVPWTPATSTASKGKSVAFIDGPPPPPPPLGSLLADMTAVGPDSRNIDDWNKFKEAGLLDESSLERKDRDALNEKISRLERELYDYQHNMGLLIIERNNLASKNEELWQEFSEAREILKREQTAHLIVISEAGKREENLKKALDVEKQCVVDLERALRDMREDHSTIKGKSAASIVDVTAQIEELEIKRLEVDSKSHSVDAKLAETNRKISELDRKLQDLETRESILKKERLTLIREQEAHVSSFRKQKEDMFEWERKLQESEQRLCDGRRILNAREEKLHDVEKKCKEKEINLEDLQKKIDLANATLKNMEEEINKQAADLDLKEKKFEALRCELEMREKQLNERDEKLSARERVELQKLLDEHKANLDAKMREFEIEIEEKRKSLEEELESKRQVLDRKETEVDHQQVKLSKREQALEKKGERLKEKEKDIDRDVKALKEQERHLEAEEKKLEAEKKCLNDEREHLRVTEVKIEELRDDISKQQKQIEEERVKLENAEEERSEYIRLQSSLREEMENVRSQSRMIEKEAKELKVEREKFERDWEALDEKRAAVDIELEKLSEEKVNFERMKNSEEERLKRKKCEIEEYVRKETDSLRVERESLEATMKHERVMLERKIENERDVMVREYEREKRNLHDDVVKKEKEWEKMVLEKERAFEETRSGEVRRIGHLKEDAEKKMEEMQNERRRMEREKWEMEINKKLLEEAGVEISKDIEALDNLRKKLRNQREELVIERNRFGSFVEKIKGCGYCGDSVREFLGQCLELPGVVGPTHAADEVSPLSDVGKKTLSVTGKGSSELGEPKSILRKCASIFFHLSPKKRDDEYVDDHGRPCDEAGPSFGLANDTLKDGEYDTGVGEVNVDMTPSVDNSNIDDSEIRGSAELEKHDLKSERRKSGRKRGVRRTNTIKAVVEEAKAILGGVSEGNNLEQVNDSSTPTDGSNLEKTLRRTTRASGARKRGRSGASEMTESEHEVELSEGKADSVTTGGGGRRKRRQTVSSSVPAPGQRRYNLRHHTATGKDVGLTREPRSNHPDDDAPTHSMDVTVESDRRSSLVRCSTVKSVEVSEKTVRFDTKAKIVDINVTPASEEPKSVENTLSEEVNGTSENSKEENASIFLESQDGDVGNIGNDGDGFEEEEEEEDDDDVSDTGEDEDEHGHPGEGSIGKKLWQFFTT